MSGYIRQKEILAILGKKSDVSVTELCERLFVSAPTIRRDLQFLEKEGLIRRTHGGAALLRGRRRNRPSPFDPGRTGEPRNSWRSRPWGLSPTG